MKKPASDNQDSESHQEELVRLTLEGLLPANQELVLNLAERTMILFSHGSDGKVTKVEQKRFSPNGMRVLVPLLRAYPKYCHHEILFASLSSLPLEEAYQQMHEMRDLTIRSVRRAISSLPARLRAFGWQVRSIRGEGYLIEAIPRKPV